MCAVHDAEPEELTHFFGTKSKTGGVSFHFCNAYNYINICHCHVILLILFEYFQHY